MLVSCLVSYEFEGLASAFLSHMIWQRSFLAKQLLIFERAISMGT
jgi:hypothetical protein